MIGIALMLAKSKWTWVVLGTIAAMTIVGITVHNFGVKRYNEGVMNERVVWQVQMAEGVAERNRLNAELRQITTQRDQISADLRASRATNLNQVREEIHNAETIDAIFNVYVAHHNSVRDEADANLARARADYLSSLGSGNDPGPGGDGFADRGFINPRASRVLRNARVLVGYGVG